VTTRETTIAALTVGDVVFSIGGRPRPFPYVVTQVVTHADHGITMIKFAHGGLVPPCRSDTKCTVNQEEGTP
jgi:hypothetical protein